MAAAVDASDTVAAMDWLRTFAWLGAGASFLFLSLVVVVLPTPVS